MEVVQEQVTIPADPSKLAELRSTLLRVCHQLDIHPSTIRRLVLAIDEAVSNIIEHGQVSPSSLIEITLEIGEEGIIAQLRDRGIRFDPSTGKSTLRCGSSGYKRGFGLYLIHLITDGIRYERTEDGKNVLTLTIEGR